MLVTALITPFRAGDGLDLNFVRRWAVFQLESGVDQVLLAGTTGEGAQLADDERIALLDAVLEVAPPERVMFAPGWGRLQDVVARGRLAHQRGVRDLLLVDPPYSGPSSASLREAWHGPLAEALPESRLFPYAVPGRTGCELLPDDLARLVEVHPNVVGVKDATGRLARMERIRELCGDGFLLLCGDDMQLRDAMIDPDIRAVGGCSVAANLAPRAMRSLVDACAAGDAAAARRQHDDLTALFGLVCVTAEESVRVRDVAMAVPQRCRNPVPLKTAMRELGLLAATCRPPLGEMGENGRAHVRGLLTRTVQRDASILAPLAEAFGVDLSGFSLAGGELVHGAR